MAGWPWMKSDWMKSVAGLGVVDRVVVRSFLGLPPWVLVVVDIFGEW